MVVVVYFLKEGHSDNAVRAIAFSSLIVGNVFLYSQFHCLIPEILFLDFRE